MCVCVCVCACSCVHTWAPACMFTRSDVGYPWSSLKDPTEQGNTEQGILLEPWTICLPSLPSTKALLLSVSYFGYLFPISFGKGFSLPQKQFSIDWCLGEKKQRMRCGEQKTCLWDPGLCNCHPWALVSSSPDWSGGSRFGGTSQGHHAHLASLTGSGLLILCCWTGLGYLPEGVQKTGQWASQSWPTGCLSSAPEGKQSVT